jgi:hypothetical protein
MIEGDTFGIEEPIDQMNLPRTQHGACCRSMSHKPLRMSDTEVVRDGRIG